MHGLISKIAAVAGQREALIGILLQGSKEMPGCLSYVVARDTTDADTLWVPFREGNVETVVNANPHLRSNGESAGQQGTVGMEAWGCRQEVGKQLRRIPDGDKLPPFSPCQRVGGFDREDVRRQERMDAAAVRFPQLQCLISVPLGKHLLQSRGSVEDVVHSSSRVARIRSTAMFN